MTEVRKRNKQTLAHTSYAFDSIWAAALMLNETSNTTRPEDFALGSNKFSREYQELLNKQEFEGLSVSLFTIYFCKDMSLGQTELIAFSWRVFSSPTKFEHAHFIRFNLVEDAHFVI